MVDRRGQATAEACDGCGVGVEARLTHPGLPDHAAPRLLPLGNDSPAPDLNHSQGIYGNLTNMFQPNPRT